MQKTPDEIKKGLECCKCGISWAETCAKGCPYKNIIVHCGRCEMALLKDALALIRQLQDDLQLEKKRTDALAMELAVLKNAKKQLEDHLREATKKVKQLEAERDAMMEYVHGSCPMCKHYASSIKEEPCASCYSASGHNDNWEWRGAQTEE